jgi:transcriptional regulator with XRE-family HTH domain
MARGRKAGGGTEGPYIHFGRVLAKRRQGLPNLTEKERTQKALASRMGVSQSFVGQLERGYQNLGKYQRGWFEKTAPHYNWTTEAMLEALGLEETGTAQTPREITGTRVLAERREDLVRFVKVPFLSERAALPDIGDVSGEVWLEDDGFLAKHPNGLFFKLGDPCMEPFLPEGWYAAVILEPSLAYPRTPALVWLSTGVRVVRYLVRWDERGEHLLYRPNPPVGRRRLEQTPPGSRVLGVVADVKRAVQPSRVPRLSSRELVAALEEEMPDLLEEVEL